MTQRISFFLPLLVACGGKLVTNPGTPMTPEDPGPACSELAPNLTEEMMCFDFNDGSSSQWVPEGGDWMVSNGVYVGSAPTLDGAQCQASSLMTSMLQGFEARNVRISLDMTSIVRADKVIVLREQDPNNRIEINLRAAFDSNAGDLVVQELRDCMQIFHVERLAMPLPHTIGEMLHVEVTLIDSHLTVTVDGDRMIDRDFDLPDRSGRIGVAVIEQGMAFFDGIIVEPLDPNP